MAVDLSGLWTMRLPAFVRRRGWRSVFFVVLVTVVLCNIGGLHVHPFEVDFGNNFSYPLDLGNLRELIEEHKLGEESKSIKSKKINEYAYRLTIKNGDKCLMSKTKIDDRLVEEELTLIFMVKSAIKHREQRDAIRKTWGYEQRFSDVNIRRIFVIGSCRSGTGTDDERKICQNLIDDESEINKDILQAEFVDTYYNNTIKTMVGMKWVVEHCENAEFALFVDDDYFVSTKNLLKFVRNPFEYGDNQTNHDHLSLAKQKFDGRLYAGYVFSNSAPMRHKTSKWYVSLDEYRYSLYPPYVTAGAFAMSRDAISDFYYASLYTKHFRFDDIYVGILAKKVNLVPLHSDNFYFWKKEYDPSGFANVIASHGFGNPAELQEVWMQMKNAGNA